MHSIYSSVPFFFLLYTSLIKVCTFNYNEILVLRMKYDRLLKQCISQFLCPSLSYFICSANSYLLFLLVTAPICVTSGI
jgi:hypothetical protein